MIYKDFSNMDLESIKSYDVSDKEREVSYKGVLKQVNSNDCNSTELLFENGEKVFVDLSSEEFDAYIGKLVEISGLIDAEGLVFVLSYKECDKIDEILENAHISYKKKKAFRHSTESFSYDKQIDLAKKLASNINKKNKSIDEERKPQYSSIKELDVLFDIQKNQLPASFVSKYIDVRERYEHTQNESEKRHMLQIMKEILSIPLDNQTYEIDLLKSKILNKHIGHNKQIMTIVRCLRCAKLTGHGARICIEGKNINAGSLAKEIGTCISDSVVELDFSGVRICDTSSLMGTSIVYENGHVGSIFEAIKVIGLHGVLILKNIDKYTPEVMSVFSALFNREEMHEQYLDLMYITEGITVICTASDSTKVPREIRSLLNEVVLEEYKDEEYFIIINEILEKYAKLFSIKISPGYKVNNDVCKRLIYTLAHKNIKLLEDYIAQLVAYYSENNFKKLPEIGTNDIEKIFEICEEDKPLQMGAIEQKFFSNYFGYFPAVRDRIEELLDNYDHSTDKQYELNSLRHLVTILKRNDDSLPDYHIFLSEISKYHLHNEKILSEIYESVLGEYIKGGTAVIGLYGPPGTGKTTVAELVSRGLNKKLVEVNLCGIKSSSFIRGTEKKFPNAVPSRILDNMYAINASFEDVILFDEVDKASDEAIAPLCELLDPSRDYFFDDYLNCQIPKSRIYILTFNDINRIPSPILDRMKIIHMVDYTPSEKIQIAKQYILPKITSELDYSVIMTEDAIKLIVNKFSIGTGIRVIEKNIKRVIYHKFRLKNDSDNLIDDKFVEICFDSTLDNSDDINSVQCGQVNAMAVSGDGVGRIIGIQVCENEFQKDTIFDTGLIKGSAKESLNVALSLAERLLKRNLEKVHIHFLDSSVEKDGTSAGIAFAIAIISCFLGKPVPNDYAFTGEIDLFGNLKPVQVDEKLSAASKSGIHKVFIPYENYLFLKNEGKLSDYFVEIVPIKNIYEIIDELDWRGEV